MLHRQGWRTEKLLEMGLRAAQTGAQRQASRIIQEALDL